MKDLLIRSIPYNGEAYPEMVSHLIEKYAVSHRIDTLNWNEFKYRPDVRFRIGYHDQEIWLKYNVNESHIRAIEVKTNGEVYKDSCVEFFVSFGNSVYYNFEFSCIGTIHLAFGEGRQNRKFVDPGLIRKIRTSPSLGRTPFDEKSGDFNWELTVIIPAECFEFGRPRNFSGVKASANFYKCGDATSEPHYVTWNPVLTPDPDYHRPEFFGIIHFE